jgi:hypothetical protein
MILVLRVLTHRNVATDMSHRGSDGGCPVVRFEKPKEHECDSRGTRDRMENLLEKMPGRWSVNVNGDSESVAHHLQTAIEQVAVELETIDGVQAYRAHRWFDRFRPKQENAQILYLLGDLDGAWNEVNRE